MIKAIASRVHNPGKATWSTLIYFGATVLTAMGTTLKDASTWADILRPAVVIPALGAGLLAVAALWDQTIRHKRKDDGE